MSKARFEAAKKRTGGVSSTVNTAELMDMSDDDIRQDIYDARITQDASPAIMEQNNERRKQLLAKMGYDFANIDDLEPHPENEYSIDMESIENLAASIYQSGNTEALLIRTMGNGQKNQILGGERRWRAHQLLRERYGEVWSMVPVRNMGVMSDEDALFVLHSDNMAQRILSPSERARGYAVIADRVAKQREEDPAFRKKYQGVRTRDILAEQFGVSTSTVSTELTISNKLTADGKELLDRGELTKLQALEVARLSEEKQAEVIAQIEEEKPNKEQLEELLRGAKKKKPTSESAKERKEKTVESLIKNARNSLKKATQCNGKPSPAMIGEIKELVMELEGRINF